MTQRAVIDAGRLVCPEDGNGNARLECHMFEKHQEGIEEHSLVYEFGCGHVYALTLHNDWRGRAVHVSMQRWKHRESM